MGVRRGRKEGVEEAKEKEVENRDVARSASNERAVQLGQDRRNHPYYLFVGCNSVFFSNSQTNILREGKEQRPIMHHSIRPSVRRSRKPPWKLVTTEKPLWKEKSQSPFPAEYYQNDHDRREKAPTSAFGSSSSSSFSAKKLISPIYDSFVCLPDRLFHPILPSPVVWLLPFYDRSHLFLSFGL